MCNVVMSKTFRYSTYEAKNEDSVFIEYIVVKGTKQSRCVFAELPSSTECNLQIRHCSSACLKESL